MYDSDGQSHSVSGLTMVYFSSSLNTIPRYVRTIIDIISYGTARYNIYGTIVDYLLVRSNYGSVHCQVQMLIETPEERAKLQQALKDFHE